MRILQGFLNACHFNPWYMFQQAQNTEEAFYSLVSRRLVYNPRERNA